MTVVIGAGASGVLTAVALAARPGAPVTVVESAPELGRGVAYSTTDYGHLLNSRTETMSLYADRPGHFLEWCRERGLYCGPAGYAPRTTYGRYLGEALENLVRGSGGRVRVVRGRAVSVLGDAVQLADGRMLPDDDVVLALGHPPARTSDIDPWTSGALDRIGRYDDVVLLGTGLTAVDVVVTLAGRGHLGRITAISRHGLLPRVHVDPPPRMVHSGISGAEVSELVRQVRRAVPPHGEWRGVVDGLRPDVERLWTGLPVPAQDRFLRHVSRLWEVHRHRMAPPIGAQLRRLSREGRLQVVAGSVVSTGPSGVTWTPRGEGSVETTTGAVVDCRGPGTWVASADPLARQLAETGVTSPDAHDLGYATTDDGQLIGADGTPVPGRWTLGPVRRGSRYETTAIPEIRAQATRIADRISAGVLV
ncbi:FAD/NAD(P)-binding protein [Cryptosporangium sp. NPDC048952]|uniref:FAD/NAD(P)-binding protein n=1 Tax=Cryptosporangium sp. NPDC048952 TaxID=3363961 RepID=UPI00371AC0E6